jgi:hypothetical protein
MRDRPASDDPARLQRNVAQPGIMPTDMASDVAGELPNRDAILGMHPICCIAPLEDVAKTVGSSPDLPRATSRARP